MSDRSTTRDVRDTFDRIADHFARTRSAPWEQVTEFVTNHPGNERGLDLGCANGRHLPSLAQVCTDVIGIDLSRALLIRARTEHGSFASLIEGEASSIPLRSNAIDLGLYIATIHHVPTSTARRRTLNQLERVLRPNSEALISTWSVTHGRFDDIEPGDHVVPWTLPSGDTVERYYYLYDLPAFEQTIDESKLECVRSWEEHGNCWAIVRSR